MRRVCPSCGFIHFEDPKVAVVALVEDQGKLLLVRRRFNPEKGKWALPAGFVDDGEDPALAVVREVREETGLEIAVTGLLNVSAGTGRTGASIIITYTATVTGGTAHPQDDAEAILWLAPDDPLPELAFDSTRQAVTRWRSGWHQERPGAP
jgi:ADP-ribose pyrophosphatase YjhB (NUDIX family)